MQSKGSTSNTTKTLNKYVISAKAEIQERPHTGKIPLRRARRDDILKGTGNHLGIPLPPTPHFVIPNPEKRVRDLCETRPSKMAMAVRTALHHFRTAQNSRKPKSTEPPVSGEVDGAAVYRITLKPYEREVKPGFLPGNRAIMRS